jgi:hypothetical protein
MGLKMPEMKYRDVIYYAPETVNPATGRYEFRTQFGKYFTQVDSKSIKYGCEKIESLIDEMVDNGANFQYTVFRDTRED